ncbi:GMP synthase [glutamine-hydrolyzing] [Pigmentiphaga humi]|uniref:GMP synthase [glutamine-hydrolyzing] n=1 Tax=Pigmentiphaga humi TaxID=2478468 RepID=A0A3P4B0U0_9BURK|nr:glutamine amidotransferase [Pigmentiphaga humi]VCU69662.1 GMP synthase [glutamine-hydrolyzing] [Pigmentiphaga humi]
MRPILILQTGGPPQAVGAVYGGFDRMVGRVANLSPARLARVAAYKGELPESPSAYAAALITGSRANVTDHAPWSEACAGWVRSAMDQELPIFGICYGHQLMSYALGGRIDYLDDGREIGTQQVELTETGRRDPLLGGMPPLFAAQFIHEQTVAEPPAQASVLARNGRDRHQMLRYGQNAVSVQFHPEFTVPVMRAYFDVMQAGLAGEGLDVCKLRAGVAETPVSHAIMRRFFEGCGAQPEPRRTA